MITGKQFSRFQHLIIGGGRTVRTMAVQIMNLFCSVNGDTDQEMMFSKKSSPFFIDLIAIGLNRKLDRDIVTVILIDQPDSFSEIIKA